MLEYKVEVTNEGPKQWKATVTLTDSEGRVVHVSEVYVGGQTEEQAITAVRELFIPDIARALEVELQEGGVEGEQTS